MLPSGPHPSPIQHYLVWLKIFFVTSFTISKWLKKYFLSYKLTSNFIREWLFCDLLSKRKGLLFHSFSPRNNQKILYVFEFCILVCMLTCIIGRIYAQPHFWNISQVKYDQHNKLFWSADLWSQEWGFLPIETIEII